MATVRNQGKPVASAKYDAFIQEQFDRARRRIRLLDVSSALLLFTAVTLAYAVIVGLLDRKLDLAPLARQVAFTGYAVASLVFLFAAVAVPLGRRINLYYAAREVERVVPGAKNSLVNWLDLHGETLPPAIRASLSQRAARDLGKADLEQAISGRRAVWLAGLTSVLVLVLFGVFITSGSGGFGTLLARTFAPFGGGATARRTELTVVRPADGDAVLGVGQPFNVAVRVAGRVPDADKPDALKLLYRYRDGEPYEEQLLQPDAGDVWMTVLSPARTFNGFRYKVVGGDAETPEFRVSVRSTPLVTGFDVTYHYRPYTGWTDDHTHDANLKALRGAEVELVIHTNRPVKQGRLEVETRSGKRDVAAELIADDPQAMRGRLVMDEDGTYRVWFTATDNDSNVAAMPYTIRVDPDHPPKVELTRPAADVTLPANGTLRLEGSASDDIGIKEVVLRLRPAAGPALRPKPYRADKTFRLADGGYPKALDYRDFVALDQLKDEQGQPFPLATGMTLEYWLEAADACDYPAPNRAESKHYKVSIAEPAADKQQQRKERDQAAAEQKKHEKQQDDKLKAEEQQRQQAAKDKEERQKEEQQSKGGEKSDGQKESEQAKGDKDLEKTAEKIKQQLNSKEEQEKGDRDKSEAKGPEDGKGEGKGDNQAGSQKPQQEKGGAKPEGQKGTGQEGAPKDEGAKQDGQRPDTGGGKPEGAQHQDAAAGERKDQGQGQPQGTAAPKPDGPQQPGKGEAKDGGQGEPSQSAGAPKEHGAGQSGDKAEAVAKSAGEEKGGAAGDKAVAKGDQPSVARGEPKPGEEKGGEPKGAPKREGRPDAGGSGTKAEAKPAGDRKVEDTAVAKGEPRKGDGQASELAKGEQQVRQGTDEQSAGARKRLEEMARSARDPQTRDLARKVLDDADKDRQSSPALPKGPPRDDAREGPTAEGKGGEGQGSGSAKTASNGGSEDRGEGKPGNGQATAAGNGKAGGQGREGGLWTPGATALQPSRGSEAPEPPPSAADPAHRGRAGVLQVEDFRKIDKNILKDLKMTPEEWEAFKKDYAAKLRRDEAEQLPASRNDNLGHRGAATVTADKADTGDAKKTGLGRVPPEFRGAYRDYTLRQSEKK
jgi:hypothetical protein